MEWMEPEASGSSKRSSIGMRREAKTRGCSCCEETDTFKHARPDFNTWPQTGHVSPLAPLHSGNHAPSPPTLMMHVLSTTHTSHPCLLPCDHSRVPTHNDRLPPPLHVAAATAYTMHHATQLCVAAAAPYASPLCALGTAPTCRRCHPYVPPLPPFMAPRHWQGHVTASPWWRGPLANHHHPPPHHHATMTPSHQHVDAPLLPQAPHAPSMSSMVHTCRPLLMPPQR